jgi:AmiR/NasT family two-component response regulator
VWGLVVDLTQSIHVDRHQLANEAVAASALSRAVIEQAKGILMGRAGLNAVEAFEHISQYSQRTNRKVVVISQEIIDRAYELTHHDQHQPRTHALLDLFRTL